MDKIGNRIQAMLQAPKSDAEHVREFTKEAGQPVPDRPVSQAPRVSDTQLMCDQSSFFGRLVNQSRDGAKAATPAFGARV